MLRPHPGVVDSQPLAEVQGDVHPLGDLSHRMAVHSLQPRTHEGSDPKVLGLSTILRGSSHIQNGCGYLRAIRSHHSLIKFRIDSQFPPIVRSQHLRRQAAVGFIFKQAFSIKDPKIFESNKDLIGFPK
jgi:hypothetical protein